MKNYIVICFFLITIITCFLPSKGVYPENFKTQWEYLLKPIVARYNVLNNTYTINTIGYNNEGYLCAEIMEEKIIYKCFPCCKKKIIKKFFSFPLIGETNINLHNEQSCTPPSQEYLQDILIDKKRLNIVGIENVQMVTMLTWCNLALVAADKYEQILTGFNYSLEDSFMGTEVFICSTHIYQNDLHFTPLHTINIEKLLNINYFAKVKGIYFNYDGSAVLMFINNSLYHYQLPIKQDFKKPFRLFNKYYDLTFNYKWL